jgi:hypothetical protein
LFRYFSFLVGDITAVHDENVVLRNEQTPLT